MRFWRYKRGLPVSVPCYPNLLFIYECVCVTESPGEDLSSSAMLLCVLCKDSFQSAWDLMVHVQAAHMMNIYELGVPKSETTNKGEQSSQQTSPATSPCPCPIHDKEVVSTGALVVTLSRKCSDLYRTPLIVRTEKSTRCYDGLAKEWLQNVGR